MRRPKENQRCVDEAVFSHDWRCVWVMSYSAFNHRHPARFFARLSLLLDEQATKMMQIPFTFTLNIPGLHNPFLANPSHNLGSKAILHLVRLPLPFLDCLIQICSRPPHPLHTREAGSRPSQSRAMQPPAQHPQLAISTLLQSTGICPSATQNRKPKR